MAVNEYRIQLAIRAEETDAQDRSWEAAAKQLAEAVQELPLKGLLVTECYVDTAEEP